MAFWDKKIAAINPGHSNNQDDSRHHLARKPSYLAASIQFRVCPIYDLRQRSELTMVCIRVADFDFESRRCDTSNLTMRNIPPHQHNRVLNKNDILLEKSGGGEQQPVGRTVLFNLPLRAVCSNFVERLVINKRYFPDFIAYLLYAVYANDWNIRAIKQTTGIQNLDVDFFLTEHADEEKQDKFKEDLGSFVHLFSYLSQLLPFGDIEIEKLFAFGKCLLKKLPHKTSEPFQLGDDVALQYYRLTKGNEIAISLQEGAAAPVHGFPYSGTCDAGVSRYKTDWCYRPAESVVVYDIG